MFTAVITADQYKELPLALLVDLERVPVCSQVGTGRVPNSCTRMPLVKVYVLKISTDGSLPYQLSVNADHDTCLFTKFEGGL